MEPRKILDQLFISKVRIKALNYFFTNPNEPIHLRGAVRELNEEINAVRRELSRMEKVGLLRSESRGNRKYFSLNTSFIFYDDLLGMVFKSTGLGLQIVERARKLGDVRFAMLTQGFTHNKPIGQHKVDVVIVGDNINMNELKAIIDQEEKRINRDIFYAVLPWKDFEVRRRRKDMFVQELFMQDLVVVIGTKGELYSTE